MTNLSGKVAIVTGATSGIGRTCCEVLTTAGAKIIATGRNEERGLKTVDTIKKEGGEAFFYKQDVCSEEDWMNCIKFTKEKFSRLDILVNNAGAFFIKPLEDTSVEEFKSLVTTNVESVFLGMKYAMPAMDEVGGGAIVNVSSLMGVVGLPDASAYCASKGAICGMTRSVALEAAATGMPLILTNVRGCRDCLIEEKNGVLVNIKDHEDIKNAMQKFIDQKELINVYGKFSSELVNSKGFI